MIGNCSSMLFSANLKKLKSENKHIGLHNRRYFFTLEAMNNAYLRSFDHIDILVDDSPPEGGVVLEGPSGFQDIDYTSDDEITVHWHDFVDHESGIKIYKVALSGKCLSDLEQWIPGFKNDTFVQEIVQTSTKLRFPNREGRYFVSVIAYNHALSPSKVVCSDGVIFDKSLPNISNISLKHSKIKESVACLDGKAWLIKENLVKVAMDVSACLSKCKNKSDDIIAKFIPESKAYSNGLNISEFICQNMPLYNGHVIYVPNDVLDVRWDISEDRSQITGTYVGFGNDPRSIEGPDIQGYVEVHHPTRYIQHHPGLIGENIFYIFIRVVNRAGLESKVWLGPILADETPPVCLTTIQPVVKGKNVVLKWMTKEVFDTEQADEIGIVMFRFGKYTYDFFSQFCHLHVVSLRLFFASLYCSP